MDFRDSRLAGHRRVNRNTADVTNWHRIEALSLAIMSVIPNSSIGVKPAYCS
jgi:hypothetical protein